MKKFVARLLIFLTLVICQTILKPSKALQKYSMSSKLYNKKSQLGRSLKHSTRDHLTFQQKRKIAEKLAKRILYDEKVEEEAKEMADKISVGTGGPENLNEKSKKYVTQAMNPVSSFMNYVNRVPHDLGVEYPDLNSQVVSAAGLTALGTGAVIRSGIEAKRKILLRKIEFKAKSRELFLNSMENSKVSFKKVLKNLEENNDILQEMSRELHKYFFQTINYST